MECVICNRSFNVELSVCPACGAMQIDSVRDELKTISSPKISISFVEEPSVEELLTKPCDSEAIPKPAEPVMIFVSSEPEIIIKSFVPKVIPINNESEYMPNQPNQPIAAKPEKLQIRNSPAVQPPVQPKAENLVEFQQKNNVIPEWRLQIQNVVRERMQNRNVEQEANSAANSSDRVLRTHGNAALKIAPVEEEFEFEDTRPEIVEHENETVRNALKRIEMSRKQFFVEEKAEICADEIVVEPEEKKDFPYQIASRKDSGELRLARKNSITVPTKPTLVTSLRNGKEDFDTNKLPLLTQPARIVSSLQTQPFETTVTVKEKVEVKIEQPQEILTETVEQTTIYENKTACEDELKQLVNAEAEEEFEKNKEVEDYAPFTLRFNAGLFDLLIGSFTSLIFLSPWMLFGSGSWFTFAGLFAFLAMTAIVMFVYLTTAVGFFGKSFGMRLFALEIIDIENEDYPSLHQAAVSSAVYLASMALGGLGFLTVPFNEEQRAVHDLVSNTLVVKEL